MSNRRSVSLTPAEHVAPSPATAAPPEDLGSAPGAGAPYASSQLHFKCCHTRPQRRRKLSRGHVRSVTVAGGRTVRWAGSRAPSTFDFIGTACVRETLGRGWNGEVSLASPGGGFYALDGAEGAPRLERTK